MSQVILNANIVGGVLSARTRALRKVGFRVAEAVSGNETLRLSCDAKPNLIVMGRMPRVSPEMCIRLKADPATSRIPVIAICSPGAQKFWARKADLCLPETITSSQLVSVIQLTLQAKDAALALAGTETDDAAACGSVDTRRAFEEFVKVAHNLRSTLCTVTVISSWIVGEYSDRMDSNGRECLGLLQKSVERMSSVIDGVLANRNCTALRGQALQPDAGAAQPSISVSRRRHSA
jgi:response regulator RpfG family c-di-GMP phosphodiesterase